MTGEERGLFRELLDQCWMEGSLPDNPDQLRRLADFDRDEFQRSWPRVLQEFYREKDGRLHHAKVDEKRVQILEKKGIREVANRKNGLKGGRPKKNPLGYQDGNPVGYQPETPSPAPAPTPSPALALPLSSIDINGGSDLLVGNIVDDLMRVHPTKGNRGLAEATIGRILVEAVNPVATEALIRDSHALWLREWSTARMDRPKSFIPQLHKWISDKDYLNPPEAPKTKKPATYVPYDPATAPQ